MEEEKMEEEGRQDEEGSFSRQNGHGNNNDKEQKDKDEECCRQSEQESESRTSKHNLKDTHPPGPLSDSQPAVPSSSSSSCPAAEADSASTASAEAAAAASEVTYTVYESELQMPDIMRLIQKELSEPYSIYTYRYFIHNWPHLCLMVKDHLEMCTF